MDKINALSGRGAEIQKDIAGETTVCECTGEFTLPDYLPEIRKIIKIDSKAIPSGKFLGGSKAEFAGIVAYTVIYSDADGKLASTSLSSEYEFSTSLPQGENTDIAIVADTEIENTVCRLSGPRKLSLRSTLKSKIHMYAERVVSELSDDGEGLESLTENILSSRTLCAESEEFDLSEIYSVDGISPDALRVNYVSAELLVREARAGVDCIVCRGDVLIKCNCSCDNGEPFTVSKKIPFENTLRVENALSSDNCIAYGRCNSASVSVSENGSGNACLNFDISAQLEGECVRNEVSGIICDIYSTEYDSTAVYKEISFKESLGCAMGNYSVDALRPKTEEESAVSFVIDSFGRADIKEIIQKDGRIYVMGECKIDLITGAYNGESCEYSSSAVTIPFKIEPDIRINSENANFDCHIELVCSRGRLDSSTIGADAEIFIALRVAKTVTKKLIDKVTLNENEKKEKCDDKITVVYPEKSDTLFGIAKKYRVPYRELAALNELPESSINVPDEKASIEGVKLLLIP